MHPLKEHRIRKYLSQQELADLSSISIRTIQRIEAKASAGSPFAIKALCKALGIEPESVMLSTEAINPTTEPVVTSLKDDIVNPHLKYINYSSFLFLALPFSNLVVPVILYLIYKKSIISTGDKNAALKILSFQILWCAMCLSCIIFIPFAFYMTSNVTETFGAPIFLWVYMLFIPVHMGVTFNTAYRLNHAKEILPYIPMIL